VELREYVRILRRSWILILVFALVGLGAGLAYSIQRTPQYEATSKVFISPAVATTVLDLDAASGYARSTARELAELAKSGLVLDPVISELQLGASAQTLAAEVSASARTNTAIIDIDVTDPDAERAAAIADAIAEELVRVGPSVTPASPDGVLSLRVTLAQQARVPANPENPRTAFNAGLGALMGLAFGLCVAFLIGVFDSRIRGQRDVEQTTKSPVLGSIGYDPAGKDQPLIVRTDPTSPRAEAFRALRTNLHFLGVGSSAHSLVVTSPDEGMGKTTTSANLALALCDADFTVCLVEGDVRRPKVAACFGIPGTVGLTDVIHGDVQLSEALQPAGHERLRVLPAGTMPPNPSELLGSREMTALLRELEGQFDVVLIDAAPLLPVTDAAVLGASASASLVVVAAGRTKRGQLEGALRALEGAGAKTYGVVLTKSPTRGPDANGYGAFERRYGATASAS
jgi:capsular exopolysaccharide synthesis family protein